METLQGGIYPLVILACVLGMKHGMDADHLATIDGLTRFNAAAGRKKLARLCGFLFSLGHGVVVCIVAVGTSFLFQQGAVPAWMDDVGAWVSAFFLLALGMLNLYAVFTTPAHEMVQMVGLKGRWLGQLRHASHPVLVATVGSLFAFSFDTLSQATLFSTTATQYGGVMSALSAGRVFHARHDGDRCRQRAVDITPVAARRCHSTCRFAHHGGDRGLAQPVSWLRWVCLVASTPLLRTGRKDANCSSAVPSSRWSPSVSCLRATPSSAYLPQPDFRMTYFLFFWEVL